MDIKFNKIFERHHAILVEGNRDFVFEIYNNLFKKNDCFLLQKDLLNIEDANFIRANAILKPSFGDFRVILVNVDKINREAEQTLLKILEEPPINTKIILILPNIKSITPTIFSRVFVFKKESSINKNDIAVFLKKDSKQRMKFSEEMLKGEDDVSVFDFLSSIEFFVKENKLVQSLNWRNVLLDIYKSKRLLETSGASKKQILEYFSITLPNI